MRILIEFLIAAIVLVGLITILNWAYISMTTNNKSTTKKTKKG